MNILVVSNLYPPDCVGGYEIGCCDVVDGLRKRGHQVTVLTRRPPVPISEQTGILRLLFGCWPLSGTLPMRLIRLAGRSIANARIMRNACARLKPDVIYVWNLNGIPVSLVRNMRQTGIPLAWYVFDDWISDWTGDPWVNFFRHPTQSVSRRVCKHILRSIVALFPSLTPQEPPWGGRFQFASTWLRNITTARCPQTKHDTETIAFGIDLDQFPFSREDRRPRKLLYVGQLVPHKGSHTAIAALEQLVRNGENASVSLTICGDSANLDYKRALQQAAEKLSPGKVTCIGFVPRERISELYRAHDILLFPSIWEEPFGIVPLEAMASGTVVVATGTGGSSDYLHDQVNCLLFPKEDATACAHAVQRLMNDAALSSDLRKEARKYIETNHLLETVINRIEASFSQFMEHSATGIAP